VVNGISVDSGINDSDFITNVATGLTISATLSGELVDGEKLEYSANSGSNWTDITSAANGTGVSYFDSGLTSSTTVQMRVTDSENNIGEVASQEIIIDTAAPFGHGVSFDQEVINGSNATAVSFAFSSAETGAAFGYMISSSGGGTELSGSGTVSLATDQITGINVSDLADGTLTLSVVLTDIAGNSATEVTATVLKDATAPTVSLTSNANDPHSGVFTVTATFSEVVTGFELGNITVANGEAANLGGSGTTYTFDVTPTEDGAVTIDIAANVAEDEASNGNVAAEQLTVMTDQTAPTVSLTSNANDPHSGVFTVTATFSEVVTGFELGNITVANGEAANLGGSGTTYTFDVTPTEDGAVTIDIAANVAEDEASNRNVAAEQLTVMTDQTAPTVSLTSNANNSHSGVFTVTATFSEEMTGFELEDITVVNGKAANLGGSGTTYTFDVTPTEDGAVTIDIAANVAEDEASNRNVAAEQLTVMTDQTAPTVSLTSNANNSHSGVFTVTATFSEEMTGFELEDITVVNGKAANLGGSGTTYTFDVTPTEDGAVTIDIAANVAEDAATNGNVASMQLSVSTDQTAPTVVISGPTDVVTEDFTATFTFSEDVAGFTADDITVVNGTKGTFAGSSTTYTIVITPELGTIVSLSVAANVAEDAAGNGNEASAVFEVQAGSPASEFAANLVEIRQVIVDEADRALRSALSVNQRMVRSARERFIAAQNEAVRCDQFGECNDGVATDIDIPFDVTGTADITNGVLSTQGSFFMQQSRMNGAKRRLSFGDFDIQHDGDTGSTTATITGRVAWENTMSEHTMLGYFVGGELGQSDIRSTNFAGNNHRHGLSVGGYVVHKLKDNLYVDSFVTLGVGRNDLELSNDVLALESDYTTQTATIGGSMSGVFEYEQFQLRPELAFTYGKTWIGTVGFTGRAFGLVDDDLSLDVGTVHIGQIMFRPEFLISLSDEEQTSYISTLSFAPRLICETSRGTSSETDCGGGVELGLKSISADGAESINLGASIERVGQSTRTSFRVNVEYRF
jgi:hypothetical protein